MWVISLGTFRGVIAGGRVRCLPEDSRVSHDDREHIIHAFAVGEDYVECAERLGVGRWTAYSIVRRYQETGSAEAGGRVGGRPGKMDSKMRDFALLLVEEMPTITLKEMNAIMRETWPHKPQVSTATMARALSGMLVSVKLCHDIPADRNRPDIIQHRKRYCRGPII